MNLFLVVVIFGAVLCLGRWVHGKRIHAALSNKYRCQPILPIPDFLGIRQLLKIRDFVHAKKVPHYFGTLYRDYGRYTLPVPIPGMNGLVTAEPENLHALFSTEAKNVGIETSRAAFTYVLGLTGIFTNDGPRHAKARSLLRPKLSRSAVSNFALLEETIQMLIEKIHGYGSGNLQDFDMVPLFHELTVKFTTRFLLGIDKLPDAFITALDEAMVHTNIAVLLGSFWWMWKPKAYRDARKAVHTFIDEAIGQAMLEKQTGKNSEQFLDVLMDETTSVEELRDHVLAILFAGPDTTSSLLSWVFWNLVRHDDVYSKVVAMCYELDGPPTAKQFEEMKYLKAVINETLRMYPPGTWSGRNPLGPLVLPRGGGEDGSAPVLLSDDAFIMMDLYSLHRRPDIWGADSNNFRPERWLERENFEREVVAAWTFLPFGGGPKSCLGQQMAFDIVMYTVIRLIQEFGKFEKRNGESDDPTFSTTPVSVPGDGVWLHSL